MNARGLVVACLLFAGCGSVAPSTDAAPGIDASVDGGGAANLLRNGDFTVDAQNWTAVMTSMTVVAGELRLEQDQDTGPGLAWQLVTGLTEGDYRLSARFVAGSYPGSYQIRVGSDVNDPTYTVLYDEDNDGAATIDFPVPSGVPSMWVTMNNVSVTTGEYAVFDDIVLIALP
jgi:hypothetical protein